MKHFKLFFACMLMLVFGFGQVWAAEDDTHDFEQSLSQLLNNNASIAGIDIAAQSYPVKEVIVTYRYNKTLTDAVTIEVSVAGSSWGTFDVNGTGSNYVTQSFSGSSSIGAIAISFTNNTGSGDKHGTFYVTNVRLVEGPASGGSDKCSTPSISPAACSFYGSQQVTITTSTTDAAIYYTTDNSTPSKTNGTLYPGSAITVSDANTTVKAIAVKDGLDDSDVASVTYTYAGPAITSYDIDFETNDLAAYVNWEFENIRIHTSTIAAHGSSTYYGSNANGSDNATASASIKTKTKYANPGILTFYVSKESNNSNSSSWKAQVSSDGSAWTDVETFNGASMSKGTWNECTADLGDYSNVFVRIYYTGSQALRAIDDISLEAASNVAKPTITVGEEYFVTSTTVTLGCTTDGATIYYTTDGTDPKTSGTKQTYSDAFTINADGATTIRAIANKGSDWSAEATSQTVNKLTAITPAAALEIIAALDNKTATTRNYLVAGTICESPAPSVTAGGTATYYISADGSTTSQLQVYKGLYKNNANFSTIDQIQAGDDVTIVGKLKKYDSNYELDQNNAIVTHKPKARLSWSAASYTASMSGGNTFPTLTNTNGVSVTYSSEDDAVATFTDNTDYSTLQLVAAGGPINITASFAGNETYKANSVSYALTVESAVERGTITFNVDGGDVIAPIPDATALPDPLPIPTKDGKNFVAWYTNSGKTDEAVPGATVTEDITLYAMWCEPYTVTEALAIIATYGNNAGGAYDVYVAGKVSTASSSNPSSGKLTYSISVDGTASDELKIYLGKGVNDANFTDKTDVQVNDQVVVLGKLYKYYNTSTFVTTPEVNTPNHLYSLTRKAEAGLDWSAASAVVGITGDKNYPTIVNPNSLTGIKYSSSDPTVASFADENTYAITLNAAGTTTITATFNGDEDYKAASVSYELEVRETLVYGDIDFNCDGANSCPDGIVHATNLPSPLPVVTKDGFNFGGWFTNAGKTEAAVAGAALTDDVTLYAKWIEIPTFDNSGYEWQLVTSDAQLVAGKYYVIGSVAGGKTASYSSGNIMTAVATTFTDGNITAANRTTAGSTVFELGGNSSAWTLAEVEDGKLLGGTTGNNMTWDSNTEWTIAIEDNNATITNKTSGVGVLQYNSGSPRFKVYTSTQAVIQLYVWAEKVYKLRYDANGGTNPPAATPAAAGKAVVTDAKPTAPTNKIFNGWNENAGGTGASYVAGDEVAVSGADVTIFAQWRDPYDNITISYDANGGEGTMDADVDQVEGTQYTIKANTFTRDGYSFIGWKAYDALDNELTITANKITVPATNVTIKAQWGEIVVSDFVLVTDVNQLKDGDKVYIAAAGYDRAMGTQNTNYRNEVGIGKESDFLTIMGAAPVEFTLGKDGDKYTFYDGTGYLYAAGTANSGKNYINTKDTYDDACDWTITIDENKTVISSVKNNYTPYMQYNSASTRFSCYHTESMQAVVLYKAANYIRSINAGRFGTICLPNGGVLLGADLYEVAYYGETSKKIFFDEILSGVMEAGVPYVFLPQEGVNKLAVVYTDDADAAATNRNGLVGFIGANEDAETSVPEGMYILQNNQYRLVSAGADARIKSYRAYINLGAITPTAPALAPGRRRISMGVASENSATGMDELNASETPVKMMIDGQLYILRGEKMYDATGRLVK